MATTLDDGLRALREAARLSVDIRVELDDSYLEAVARLEARPDNQTGSDKTWVWRAQAASRAFRAAARPSA